MVIDIISYSDEQFATMTDEQLLEVQSAQMKKNRLMAALEEDLQKEKYRLINNGTYLSSMWPLIQEKLQKAYEQEVDLIRDALLFYLQFSLRPDASDSPYLVDYTLPESERMYIVKDYYMEAYTDDKERFEAFKADEVAVHYLGEFYAPMYDYFRSYIL